MTKDTIYGDESSRYKVLARDMTPEEARRYLEENANDGILLQMPSERLFALNRRSLDGGL